MSLYMDGCVGQWIGYQLRGWVDGPYIWCKILQREKWKQNLSWTHTANGLDL